MPVQINEMIIRATIQEPQEQKSETKKPAEEKAASKDEIIKECTEIILEILKHKKER
jgi:phenylpyruvate tautomerase PptA (4-oxalocrotonate tautomerase family)